MPKKNAQDIKFTIVNPEAIPSASSKFINFVWGLYIKKKANGEFSDEEIKELMKLSTNKI